MTKKQNNPKNKTGSEAPKAQPVEEVRIASVKAAIWRNDTETGPRFNVTLQRIYRDGEGKWHSTISFGRDDLLTLAKVADAAHTRVMQLIGEQREQERDRQNSREPVTA